MARIGLGAKFLDLFMGKPMRIDHRFLAALLCAFASVTSAQDAVPPSPDDAPAIITEGQGGCVDSPGISDENTSGPAAAPENEAPEILTPEEGANARSAGTSATVPPGDWVTQPDTRPFELGMPYDMQSDGAFR